MQIQVKKAINIPDGQHEGAIIRINYRQRPFQYVDLNIQMMIDEQAVDIKVGYPQIISKASKLGLLLERFGAVLEEGESLDPDKILIGQKCRFKTMTETNSKGTFARIIPDSVIPMRGLQVKL